MSRRHKKIGPSEARIIMKLKTFICLAALLCAGTVSAKGVALRAIHGLHRTASNSAGPVAATTNSNSTATATSSSRGGHATGVGSQGQSIDSHAVYQAQARNPVSTAVAPPIISSNDTCMGSTSIAGAAVSFGFSAGTTWTDANCVMLKNSREMWNMGFKGSALARLCMDQLNKEAFEATGINCPPRRQASTNEKSSYADGLSGGSVGNRVEDVYRY
jgi:hypothetical protein